MPPTGYYIPMNAIKPIDKKTGAIFIVDGNSARKIAVAIGESVGELILVKPTDPQLSEKMTAGARLISDHVHFLQDGESVRVVKTEEIKL